MAIHISPFHPLTTPHPCPGEALRLDGRVQQRGIPCLQQGNPLSSKGRGDISVLIPKALSSSCDCLT